MGTLSLLESVIKKDTEAQALFKANGYNIFSVLQIQSKELFYCRMIADLLNPRGQHGFGAVYLSLFVRHCLGIEGLSEEQLNRAVVTTEYLIDAERRIDIVIETGSHFFPVEVKIYAADQKSQCFDYYEFAKRKDSGARLYYLTLDGHTPANHSISSGNCVVPEDGIVCLSFREHLLEWLRACKDCKNPVMVPILEQFIATVEKVSGDAGERVRTMVVEEITASADSMRAGIQIADAILEAKVKLICLVFEEFEKQLAQVADKHHWTREKNADWYEYRNQAEVHFYKWYSTYPGINYIVNDAKMRNGKQLWFRVEIEHRLFAGFCVFDTSALDGKGNQVNEFDRETTDDVEKYLNVTKLQQDDWWADWWYLPTFGRKADSSVPNFKLMNDAATALADKEKRAAFVTACIRQLEILLEKLYNK